MVEKTYPGLNPSPVQILYARILEKGMFLGLALLLITFAIYAFGIMKPYIALSDVSRYWSYSVTDYLHMAHVKPGWAWTGMLGYGDFINFIGIAILAGTTVICYLSIIPMLWRSKDKIYAILALLEAVILTIAASGLLGSGGH